MRSPGRPGVNQRDAKQAFWERIAAGATSEDAALASGVSQPVGTRWFREAGGMVPISMVTLSGRFLSFGEREELALLNAQRLSIREIARRIERSPSTISRELRRNAETRGGVLRYRATVAQWKAERAATRPKAAKLTQDARLRRMCKIDSPALLPTPAACRFRDRRWHGRDGAMAAVPIDGGASAGARSRSADDCRSTSRMMRA
jgi:DNA-binding CsgD family transcriptional regulator